MDNERTTSPEQQRADGMRGQLQVHFWFTEQMSTTFKSFAALVVFWFAGVYAAAYTFQLFTDVQSYSPEKKLTLILLAGLPLILMAYVLLRFYWWASVQLARVSGWGKDVGWPRHFWFWVLTIGSFAWIDPLDVIGKFIAKFPAVQNLAEYGIPAFNPAAMFVRIVVALLVVMLLYDYLKQGWLTAWAKATEIWEEAVSLCQGLAVTLTNFLRPNVCVEYPEYRCEVPAHFRGRHMLMADESGMHKCIACRACERACPDRLILISATRNPETRKQELTGFLLDNSRCCFCGLCEDACPTDAIKHTNNYEYACYDRSELVIDLFGEYLARTKELRAKHGGVHVS